MNCKAVFTTFAMLSALLFITLCFSACGNDEKEESTDSKKLTVSITDTKLSFDVDGNTSQTIQVSSHTPWSIQSDEATWCQVTPRKGNPEETFTVSVTPNHTPNARILLLTLQAGTEKIELTIHQEANSYATNQLDSLALVAIYQATDGPYWDNNEWDLSKQISEWAGVTTELIAGTQRVTKLVLFTRSMDGELPADIKYLTELTRLDLHGNLLSGSIPTEIGYLTKLTDLDISNNRFTGELPSSIAQLSKLTKLDVSQNKLSLFPVEICQLESLVTIEAQDNRITTIPGEITQLANLEYLYLQNNQLTELPKGLDKLTNLKNLMLEGNLIKSLPDNLGDMKSLVYLQLNNNKLTGSIPASLSALVNLTNLDLSENTLTGSLPDLTRMTGLKNIYLGRGNKFTGSTLPDFRLLIKLENVEFDGLGLTGEISPSIGTLTNLKTLFLSDNQLSGNIPKEIATPQSLTHLYLYNNNFTGTIPVELMDRVKAYKSPLAQTHLRLYMNRLSGELPVIFLNGGYQWTNMKPDTYIYPQQEGYGFTNIKK